MKRATRRREAGPRTVGGWWGEIASRFAWGRLFFGHGTHDAPEEAAWLLCQVLRIPFDALPGSLDRPVGAAAAHRLEHLATQRVKTREPLAYILREAWLADHRFYVDRRVIVPRSHIAELLPDRLAPWLPWGEAKRVLDLCTGSGCLAILAALAFPTARVDASDVSAAALAVARRNVKSYRLGRRIRLVRSDLFAALPGRYELILCNPPYVPAAEMRRLPAEYRAEPRLALDGGRDGLGFVRRLLAEAADHLAPDGVLVVEIGAGRKTVERAFPRLPFTWLATHAGEGLVFLLRRTELAARR
ncbi:MAG TPA: 50S ribosomal protein L3 N(5)-glutamine methyltransferase [Dehalococcoidia bacterium]|nr:50S ribosomal protein L3 N(5)-glutamine methyltransferase [Dehalococcoidia bacterium]